jgi:hypothetical protein
MEPVKVTPPRRIRKVLLRGDKPTDQDAQVACYKVQSGDITTNVCHDTSEAGKDRSQSNHRVQRCNSLR